MATKQVLPSRMTLQQFKAKSVAAKKGFELLKKKADALKAEFRKILGQILAVKKQMGKDFNACMLSLAEANWAAGEFSRNVQDGVKMRAQVTLLVSTENIAGCKLPIFSVKEYEDDSSSEANPLGLTAGGQTIMKCKDRFKEFLNLLIKIASLQTSFITLDEVIKITNRRVNALDYVVIPGILNTVKHIQKELDELDREDFFRLKKVKDKKEQRREAAAKIEAEKQGLKKDSEEKDLITMIQEQKETNPDDEEEGYESDEEGQDLF